MALDEKINDYYNKLTKVDSEDLLYYIKDVGYLELVRYINNNYTESAVYSYSNLRDKFVKLFDANLKKKEVVLSVIIKTGNLFGGLFTKLENDSKGAVKRDLTSQKVNRFEFNARKYKSFLRKLKD